MSKRILTQADVEAAAQAKLNCLEILESDIVTPLAREAAQALGLVLRESQAQSEPTRSPDQSRPSGSDPKIESGELNALVAEVIAALSGKLPPGSDSAQIRALVSRAVSARLAKSDPASGAPGQARSASGALVVDSAKLLAASALGPMHKAVLAEAIGGRDEAGLCAGYIVWDGAELAREVKLPEIGVVIEGELRLQVDGESFLARPGDMFFLPKGVKAVYQGQGRVKLACVNRL